MTNTTNTLDDLFADLKNKLRNHNGLSKERKIKFMDGFFQAWTSTKISMDDFCVWSSIELTFLSKFCIIPDRLLPSRACLRLYRQGKGKTDKSKIKTFDKIQLQFCPLEQNHQKSAPILSITPINLIFKKQP